MVLSPTRGACRRRQHDDRVRPRARGAEQGGHAVPQRRADSASLASPCSRRSSSPEGRNPPRCWSPTSHRRAPPRRAGLALGDAIVGAGGHPLGAGYDLVGLLDEWDVAVPLPVDVVRAGSLLRRDVGSRPTDAGVAGGGHVTRLLVATASATTRSWFAAFPSRRRAVDRRHHRTGCACGCACMSSSRTLSSSTSTGSELDEITSSMRDDRRCRRGRHPPRGSRAFARVAQRISFAPASAACCRVQPTPEELESALRAVGEGLVVMDPGVLEGRPQEPARLASPKR